ncbi:MAG: metal ABC transporter ATP-binding protein [Candidatus Bathyarchaeia archaeon]
MAPIIELRDVSTVYEGEKRPAVRDINLIFERGEFVHVIGPNASGKTTLLETINGLLPVSKGRVLVLNFDVQKHGREVRRFIGYVPQDFMVDPGEPYTALDVVLMGRYGKIGVIGRPIREDKEKAIEAMKLLGIKELANKPVGKLSGGQQQKVMIARALVKEPKILLLDEPFSNLDPESKEKVSALISHLNEEQNITTIIVTHDIQQILNSHSRIVVMNSGRVIADGDLKSVLAVAESFLPTDFWRKER